MATSKSTVVGIRLDHERRAWAEAEAARLGVSMRGLFEGMIDEARAAEAAGADRAIAGLGSAASPDISAATTATKQAVEDPRPPATADQVSPSLRLGTTEEPASSARSGIGSVTTVPGGLIREALSLATSLFELGGRCATKRLSNCVLTRGVSNHSA